MSVLVGKDTKLLVQGLGGAGRFHADKSIAYGTNVVGAVHPSRAGETEVFEGETDHSGVLGREDRYRVEVPIYATIAEAEAETGANASVIFFHAAYAADANMEATADGVELVISITKGIQVNGKVVAKRYLERKKTRLIGPNCPGEITPH